MVVDDGKGACGEEVGGDVEIAGIPGAVGESGGGEAMGWDVGECGGEDGVFCWAEGPGGFVLVGMVGAATLPKEARSEINWVPRDSAQMQV